ncbi:hypothetical protein X945_5800 [Burkholderia pseudomallei ABCPW 107]|nr:hypothetical protein X945_5800 [Burkholderia pseudomallei ABCPW 107]
MHAPARLRERRLQRRREAPGAVAFAADEQHGVRVARRRIAGALGLRAPPARPQHHARHREQRRGERRCAEHEPEPPQSFARVQHLHERVQALPAVCGLVGERGARRRIDEAGAVGRLQFDQAARLVRRGEAQLAQRRPISGAQRGHLRDGYRRLRRGGDARARVERERRRRAALGNHAERRQRQHQPGQRRQHEPRERDARGLVVQPLQSVAANRARQAPPAAHPVSEQREPGQRDEQHRGGGHARRDPPGVAEQELAVQVREPAHDGRRAIIGERRAGRRIDDRCARPVGARVVRDDFAGRPAHELLDARHLRAHAAGERRDVERRARGAGDGRALERRLDRQRRARQRDDDQERGGDQAGNRMKLAQHGVPLVFVLQRIAERLHVAAALDRLAGARRVERHDDFRRVLVHVLDGGVDVDFVAGVEQRVGDVERRAQRPARADARARDAVQPRRAARCAIPVAQVSVILRLAAGHP